jgi:L-lysine 2,3-aminomutase
MKYQAYTINNFKAIPQISRLDQQQIRAIEVVGSVLPFKTNNYVVDRLINWNDPLSDPMFILTFPQRGMLSDEDYQRMDAVLKSGADKETVKKTADEIRHKLNPHPAGQMEHNVPVWQGTRLEGVQHKYRETVVFFPSHGQTCHAFCTFCFRWPQFVGIEILKFASKESALLVDYVSANNFVTDILFTGGDPLTMSTELLAGYIRPLVKAKIPHLNNIRIGSKALSYWPQRFTGDKDSAELLELFKEITSAVFIFLSWPISIIRSNWPATR